VVGEVVVVFDGLEGRGLAEEAEVVDWDGSGEEGLKSCVTLGQTSRGRESCGGDTHHPAFQVRISELAPRRWRTVLLWLLCIHSRLEICPVICLVRDIN
jgi:hypothetical protein